MSISHIGVIAIGRNEGDRLVACLRSALDSDAAHVVYVDSGSTDGSVDTARSLGVEVVELDLSTPFTAARARNEGMQRLLQLAPGSAGGHAADPMPTANPEIPGTPSAPGQSPRLKDEPIQYVQMIDGDCTLDPDWLNTAAAALDANPKLAVVCGRRRERFPDATVYNRLADMEWDTPIGPARSCGGDALFRVEAFQQAGGYDPTVIAGEEPELCVRLRQAGWTIERLDAEMTLHDANMTKLGQWWKRNVRAGHAYAQGAHLHGKTDGHNVKQVRSIVAWGIGFPIAGTLIGITVIAAYLSQMWPIFAIAIGMYTLMVLAGTALIFKVAMYRTKRGDTLENALRYSLFTVNGKIPNALGVLKFHWNRLRNKQSTLIEYKPPAEGGTPREAPA